MKKFISHFLLCVMLTMPSLAFAGAASVYKITITKMELWNGSSWVEVFSGSSDTIDIASVGSGGFAGNFLSGITIPDGTYTQVRTTVSTSIAISGTDSSRFTTIAENTVGMNTGCLATAVEANQGECDAVVDTTPVDTTTFSAPITALNNNLSHKIRVEFDVSNAVTYNGGANTIFANAPTVTVTAVPLN